MTQHDDLTPPPARDLPPGRLAIRRDHLVRELDSAAGRWRRPRRAVMLAPVLLLGGVGGAWAAGVFDAPVRDVSAVECRAPGGAAPVVLPSDISGRLPRSATEVCAGLFAGGGPPLVSCRGEARAVVLAGARAKETCDAAGLELLPDTVFRREVRRQVAALGAVLRLVPDRDGGGSFAAGEAPPCRPAGAVARAGVAVLERGGFANFAVRLAPGGRSDDCATSLRLDTAADGRTLLVDTERTDPGGERAVARAEIRRPPCRRTLAEGRPPGTGPLQLLGAVACVDAALAAERGRGLTPGEAPRVVADRLGLNGWRIGVRVPQRDGRPIFVSTTADPRRRTLVIGFAIRPLITPGTPDEAADR